MKVIGSYWFSPMGGQLIGIVKVAMEYEGIGYFIGNGAGADKEADEKLIASTGAAFPNAAGDLLMGDWV